MTDCTPPPSFTYRGMYLNTFKIGVTPQGWKRSLVRRLLVCHLGGVMGAEVVYQFVKVLLGFWAVNLREKLHRSAEFSA